MSVLSVNPLWVEKYRPHKIADTILPAKLKETFQKFIDDGSIPNMTFAGGAGVGKTTVAKAMFDELGCDYITVNGSMNGNIDTLRNEILQFASSVSLAGGRKYVILDEADYLNPNSTQPALRNFMEEYSKNCGFILTCNFKNKIIEPLHSRAPIVDFKIPKAEAPQLAAQFMKRITQILKDEGVEYDQAAVAGVIQKHFPDFRRTLGELQRYSATGKIDSGILANHGEVNLKNLISDMRDKNYSAVRKWVAENLDNDQAVIFRKLYETMAGQVTPSSFPTVVLILAKYQYQAAFVVDHEINLSACLAEVMIEAVWK